MTPSARPDNVIAGLLGEGHGARPPPRAGPGRAGSVSGAGPGGAMTGYTEDEKLRLQQLRALRRRWLRDQELSEREPVLPPQRLGPVAAFWERFLRPGGLWRQQVYKACQTGGFVLVRVLVPAWIILYYLKYHGTKKPLSIVTSNPRIFPGDRILETGEIIPPMKEEPGEHH
ncbi:NADH dehydrogenase [ubiquinone] 1 beta subcomplex subunit 6 isoform X1 [Pezoporus wallicus]|uniref:NADH dehydrogenase [ubiquinone] 1 beta subcomplex subunit 6 isoform X1 n=1 Tax=Pezoporus wallicus TaxID=35540 RepID=UPI00254C6AD6|nr:NADH dehydrogenase [ubiquinone] 1 beta subcomplex subunit 6 isoform X1 [Pezoporus wallicus]